MDLPGEAYLFNLSLLAVTFATISAVVMLLRQTMGGKLSDFDIHLITAYLSGGFAIAVGSIMPSLIALGAGPPALVPAVASAIAAVLQTAYLGSIVWRRRKAARGQRVPVLVLIDWFLQGLAIVALAANAAIGPLRSIMVFAAALTFALAVLMWSFIRRIASLLGSQRGEDWDPKRG